MLRRVGAAACIVLGVSGCHVRGDARVVLGRTLAVPEDVHETLQHKGALSNQLARQNDARSRGVIRTGREIGNCSCGGQAIDVCELMDEGRVAARD
jgi:hypothetical protein